MTKWKNAVTQLFENLASDRLVRTQVSEDLTFLCDAAAAAGSFRGKADANRMLGDMGVQSGSCVFYTLRNVIGNLVADIDERRRRQVELIGFKAKSVRRAEDQGKGKEQSR
jgi:hypothetical protein